MPLGSDEFVRGFVHDGLLGSLDGPLQKLVDFEDSQAALYLLRVSYSIVRAVHFMRTTPLSQWKDEATEFDARIRGTAELILGRPFPDETYSQVCLSTKLGGLGLRRTVEHADLAFSASWHESRKTAREVWNHLPNVSSLYLRQDAASLKFDELRHTLLLSFAPNDREHQRLLRSAQPHASGFLIAVPSCADGYDTVMSPRVFRTAVLYRLGLPVVNKGATCPMCKQPMDVFGDHAVCCIREGDIIRRHNRLRNLINSVASDGVLSPVMEILGMLPSRFGVWARVWPSTLLSPVLSTSRMCVC